MDERRRATGSAGGSETRRTSGGEEVVLAPVGAADRDALFVLFGEIVAAGEGYPHSPPLTRDVFEATWVHPVTIVVGASIGGVLVGAYYLKPNSPGRAAHIANAGYLVVAERRGHGLGELLVRDSIRRAPRLGFDAIQFNLVFAANPARRLYERLGWVEIGRVPDAIPGDDAIIYYRKV
jgi:GNAT superfamily N-acetyltransferase